MGTFFVRIDKTGMQGGGSRLSHDTGARERNRFLQIIRQGHRESSHHNFTEHNLK